jgi:hypothetical protein
MTTQRKWLYAGIFNFIASFISLGAHLIPTNGNYILNAESTSFKIQNWTDEISKSIHFLIN